jgi:hypothetical protein
MNPKEPEAMTGPQYRLGVTDPYMVDGRTITCPICGADRDLVFLASVPEGASLASVHAGTVVVSCPDGHAWDERRVPAVAIREVALGLRR